MKTFNFFTTGQSLILPMCASPRYYLCKVRHFPVLNLLRLQRKKKHTSVFCLICSFRKNCHKMGIRRIFFFRRLTWSYLVFTCWSKWALSVLGRVHSVSYTASFPRLPLRKWCRWPPSKRGCIVQRCKTNKTLTDRSNQVSNEFQVKTSRIYKDRSLLSTVSHLSKVRNYR